MEFKTPTGEKMPHYKRVHYQESIVLLPVLTIMGINPTHPPPERSSDIKPESPGVVSDISRNCWKKESTCPFKDVKGVGVFSPHPPPDMRSHTKPVSRRAPSGVPVDCGNVTGWKQSEHLPPLNQRGVGVLRPHPPDRSSVWDPQGHITILNVLKDYGDITGSRRAAHRPPVTCKGAGVERPELHKRCKVIPAITKACKNIPGLQQPKDLPPLNMRGVGLHSPLPPSDITPQIKPEGHDVLPSTSEKKECGNIKRSQKSKLPPINTRGVGALRPHPPDRNSVMDHESRKTILDLLRDYENITGSQQAAHLSTLKGAGVERPKLHKRCKVLPAITKACKNITGPQQYEDISLVHVRGVGLHSPHPPSDFTPQIKPEGHDVLPSTSEKKECGNFKRSQKSKLPSTNLRGLRPEPTQRKIQLWEPSDRPFAFVCKRMLEDAKMDREYQNSLSVADRETFSSRCKTIKMDEMKDILWRKKS